MAIGEIIGALLGGVGGIMGASAENKANKQNYEIALANLGWDKEKFNKMLDIALRQEQEGKLGQTDAYGNRYHYVEGKGWVIDLTPEQKIKQALQLDEEKRQLVQDIPAKREAMFGNIAAQRGEGQYADALLQQMHRTRMQDPHDVIGMRNRLSSEAIADTGRTASEAAARTALSMGNTAAAGNVVSQIGASQGDALRKAFMENQATGTQEAQGAYDTTQGNLANLYNMFRTRASAMPDAPYNPRNLEGAAAAQLSNASTAGRSGSQNLLNAFQQPTPQLNYKATPEYGMANTFANLGSSIGNINWGGSSSSSSTPSLNWGGNYGSSNNTLGADYYKQNTGPW